MGLREDGLRFIKGFGTGKTLQPRMREVHFFSRIAAHPQKPESEDGEDEILPERSGLFLGCQLRLYHGTQITCQQVFWLRLQECLAFSMSLSI